MPRLRPPGAEEPEPRWPGRRGAGTAARRERTIAATPEELWAVVEDPHHMPRWWPGVARMEGVEDDRFTQVFLTRRGRPVRVDFRVVASEPPRRRVWMQDIVGTPFERFLRELEIEIVLEPVAAGTRIVLAERQKLRGYSRTGGFLMRRARAQKLAEALENLEQITMT
jgi:uncharacterized protein YndB with AHSA1/START domain